MDRKKEDCGFTFDMGEKIKWHVDRIPKLTIYLFFLIISLSIYANSLNGNFILDDKVLLVDNIYIKDISFIPKLFTIGAFHFKSGGVQAGQDYYRPFQALNYSFEYFFWKLNPLGYHLTSIFVHSLNSFLVFFLIYLIFQDSAIALLSASLFCVHPIQVSLVAFISCRGHLLAMMFMLLSLITFIRYAVNQKKASYIVSLLLFVFALLSWEGALLSPLISIICMLFLGVHRKKIIFYLVPYILIAAIYLCLRAQYIPSENLVIPNVFSLPRIFGYIRFFYIYISQLIFPYGLGVVIFNSGTFFRILLLAVSSILLGYFLIKVVVLRDKITIFAFLFYSIGLLFVIPLLDTIAYFGTILSEHYICVSLIGFCIFIGTLVIKLEFRFKKAAHIVFAAIITVYSAMTIINNTNYKDDFTFYNHILSVDKNNTFVRINLGNNYYEKKIFDKAIEQANFVLASEPKAWDAYLLLGNIFNEIGHFDKAEELYNKALILNPNASEPVNNLGLIYKTSGRGDKALEAFGRAIKINPESLIILHNLVNLLSEKKLYNEALAYSIKMLELSPHNVMALVKTGIILAELGRVRDAEILFEKTLRLDPNSIEAMRNLGSLYGNMGEFDKALALWKKALEIKPDDEEIKQNIKRLTAIKGP